MRSLRLVVGLAIAAGITFGATHVVRELSAQDRPVAEVMQRITIEQNGIVLGTLEVPSGVFVKLGTTALPGGTQRQAIHIGQPSDTPPVVVSLTQGAAVRPPAN
jgi:hypothetical protein